MNILKKVYGRLKYAAQARFKEPIVVFESDDWGMMRQPSAGKLKTFGEPGEWSEEAVETETDLNGLYQILGKYKDSRGRKPVFTANFIAFNPDFDRINNNKFSEYFDIPIDRLFSESLIQKYKEGVRREIFFPQHHGRRHFCSEIWLQDLQKNEPGAKELFDQGCCGGLSLLQGQGWRYHTEYLNWKTGKEKSEAEIKIDLKETLSVLERIFGYKMTSTIAPHYIFTKNAERAWLEMGILYVQGTGYCLQREKNGHAVTRSHYMGEKSENGLLYMTRTIKFDPRPERKNHHWQQAYRNAASLFDSGIPVVIDTHRINYTGGYREAALEQLDSLLKEMNQLGVVFLTSCELGEAVLNGGKYTDVFSREKLSITPVKTATQKFSRFLIKLINGVCFLKL